jgi:hypothetical protein
MIWNIFCNASKNKKKEKILKPQQDKFVKDKLLNEIFQEIADENAEADNAGHQEEKSTDDSKDLSKKKKLQTIRLRIIIVLLVVLILYVLFNPKEKTDKIKLQDPKGNIYSIPIANQIPTEEKAKQEAFAKKEALAKQAALARKEALARQEALIKKEAVAKKNPIIKISEKETIVDTKIIPEADTKNTQTLNIQEPKTTREKAKDQLMQQMQN